MTCSKQPSKHELKSNAWVKKDTKLDVKLEVDSKLVRKCLFPGTHACT